MAIKSVIKNGKVIITISGSLAREASVVLMEQVQKAFSKSRYYIALEMSQVDFLDSSALGVLVFNKKTAEKNGGDVVLLNPSSYVLNLLDSTRLSMVLKTISNEDSLWVIPFLE